MGQYAHDGAIAVNHVQPTTTTEFHEIPISGGSFVSIQVVWHDATSAFSAALQETNQPVSSANKTSVDASDQEWSDVTLSPALPTVAAGAAGSWLRDLSGVASRRMRLAITTTANSRYSIYVHGKE